MRKLFGDAPWDGAEGKALDELLKAVPALTVERVRICLANRTQSDVNLAERPRKWIRNLTDYELGPLDPYGKPKALSKRSETTVGINRAPSVAQTATTLQREAEDREGIVEFWRELRSRGSATYKTESPRWVRELLETEQTEQDELAVA